jgi:hypothetical protein
MASANCYHTAVAGFPGTMPGNRAFQSKLFYRDQIAISRTQVTVCYVELGLAAVFAYQV